MTSNHAVLTSDYLLSTQSVLNAGNRLRNLIDADRATLEYAITRLERAAQQHEDGGTGYRAFMFSELETATEADKAMRERLTEDALASVLADLQVANVLIAAGQTLGETGERAEPRLLNEALLRLENTTRTIEQSLASPLAEGVEPGRFGFAEEVAAPETVQSADLPSAIETLKSRSDETLTALVNETQGVMTSVLTALDKIDKAKVTAALSNLGFQVQALPRVGRLFRQGVEKLEGAIDALIRLLGSEVLAQIKAKVEEIWQKVKKGEYIAQTLKWAFGVEATRTHIAEILGSEGLERAALDEASNALSQLVIKFKENMAMAQGLTSAVTLAGTLLALTPLAGPELALVTASAYVLILAAVVLIGMDYADSGRILQRVRGVGEIADSVRPV
jgi:hypothetical protein